ncbi:hypothetical protein BH23GEM7_BH23GEM7_12510 [soil metagenome]
MLPATITPACRPHLAISLDPYFSIVLGPALLVAARLDGGPSPEARLTSLSLPRP